MAKKNDKKGLTDFQKNVLFGVGGLGVIYLLYNQIFKDPVENISKKWMKENGVSVKMLEYTKGLDVKVNGDNFFYYPPFVNQIADLSADQLRQINLVWDTYFLGESNGLSLKQALADEDTWDYIFFGDHSYKPAIDWLDANGY